MLVKPAAVPKIFGSVIYPKILLPCHTRERKYMPNNLYEPIREGKSRMCVMIASK